MRLNCKQETINEVQRKKISCVVHPRHSPIELCHGQCQKEESALWNSLGLLSILYLIMLNMVTLSGRQFSSVWIQLSVNRIGVMYDNKE